MFRNYFLICYRRHKCFCPISVYFLPNNDVSIFWGNDHSVFLNHLCRGSLLLRNWNRSCDEHQASKWIDLNFVRKRRTGRRSNGGTSHFVLCETKLNNLSMLCMTISLYCVWKFVYFVYDNFSMLCMTYFDYSSLYILCMTLSLTSTFLYII